MTDSQTDPWYFDEALWRHFHDCMFSEADFMAAEQQTADLLTLTGVLDGNILDLACGPGRHSLPLAARGFAVTAMDSSRYLLEELQRRRDLQNLDIEIVHSDMRHLDRQKEFDLVLSMHTSFGYFEEAGEDLQFLTRIRKSMKPEGRFLLDLAGKEYIARQIEPLMVRELAEGSFLIEQPEVFDNCSRLKTVWTLVAGHEVHRTQFRLRIYSAVELETLCHEAGFSEVSIYGDLQGSPYDLDSDRLIIVAAA